MGMREQIILAGGKEGANAGHATGTQIDNAKIAQTGFGEDNAGDNQHTTGDQSTDGVGEDVSEHNAGVLCTQGSGNQYVFLILEAVELHSGTRGHTRPSR